MKKILILLTVLVLAFFAASCSSETPQQPPKTTSSSVKTVIPPQTETKKKVSVKFYDRDTLVAEQNSLDEGTLLNPQDYSVSDDETFRYTFAGWDANGDGVPETFPYELTSDTIFTSIIEKEYITYHYDIFVFDKLVSSVDCHYNDEIVYPEVSSSFVDGKAYIYVGWKYDGVFDGYTKLNVLQNMRIDAYFAENQVVTFSFEGSKYAQIIEAGNPITIEDSWGLDAGEGYYIAWYLDEGFTSPLSSPIMPEGNLPLFGRREPAEGVEYTVVSSADEMINSFNYTILNRETNKQYFMLYDYGTPGELVSYLADRMLQLYSVSISAEATDKFNLKLSMSYSPIANKKTNETEYTQLKSYNISDHTAYRSSSYNDFAIEKINDTLRINNSEALYFAIENGYRPVCTDKNTAELYEKMKSVLRYAVSDSMTDIQKAKAIYEYLIMNVTYDGKLGEMIEKDPSAAEGNNSFFLEGVFNDKLAVCDGISKAFTCLCRMEGIPCVRVTGKKKSNDVNHAWNKVKLGANWYGVDATAGGTIVGSAEVITYHYFLMSDSQLNAVNIADKDSHNDIVCARTYDIYSDMGLKTTSVKDAAAKLKAFFEASPKGKCSYEIELSYTFSSASSAVDDILKEINETLNIEYVNEGNHFCFIYTKV